MKRHLHIDKDSIAHVYSGKAGACACGCKGKHTYASAYVAQSEFNRGYAIQPDEVSDKTVTRIVNKIEAAAIQEREDEPSYACAVIGGRIYIAYFPGA